jgi:hypothetical protein
LQARRVLLLIGIVMLLVVVAASLVPPPQDGRNEGSEEDEPAGAVEPPPASPATDAGAAEVTFRARPSDQEDEAANPRGSEDGASQSGDQANREGRNEASRERTAAPTRKSQTRTVDVGERVVLTVATPNPGGVEVEGLGRLQVAAPGAPAVFDLFTDAPGRYDVIYTPAKGNARVLGTLVVGGSSPTDTRDGQ